ncbi:enoyl-CoA hydratase/isomerase family protein [Bacillus sp. REN16]|uniref:enoyl-CoA hydratase/isomerase family protein n=1 Tax=Bacillus sp. REN16 TaxID=2887296 RepID=UPI001E2D8A67|nr:enoyl-CoA hydratase/isomerase family protein [Bacillus sp. REN16]MCC3357582.1 enoyl-CoA hydratase/isomerase family protein [Bacillus sp. REN16]
MSKYIVKRDARGIVWFTINRPEKWNAIDYDVMDGLLHTLTEVEKNEEDQVLVITGAGQKSFCSGGDLSIFQNLQTVEEAYQMLMKMGMILYKLATLTKPTIALLNGLAIGGGCELATACDYRLATQGSRFGFVQGKQGITTGWGGATLLLERVSIDKAFHLLLGGEIISAEDGKELGFIQHVLSKDDAIKDCEEFIANEFLITTKVVKAYKKVVNRKWLATGLKERILEEIEECSALWVTDEHLEAVQKIMRKE